MRYGYREGFRHKESHSAQPKVRQIHRMESRRRKRQVDIGKIRKREEGNVDIGNGT